MKAAPIALLLATTPALADVAVKLPATWRDRCADKIDEAARAVGLEPGAQRMLVPLLREDGTPNPVEYVVYAQPTFSVTVGSDAEPRPDAAWKRSHDGRAFSLFRRWHHRFGLMMNSDRRELRGAIDQCLEMGEAK